MLEPVVFGGGEAELTGLSDDEVGGLEGIGSLAHILGHDVDRQSVFGLGEKVVGIVSLCTYEGTVTFLRSLVEAGVEHGEGGILGIVVEQVLQSLLQAVGDDVVLDHQRHKALLEFLVFVYDDDRLSVVGYGLVDQRCFVDGILDVAEEFLISASVLFTSTSPMTMMPWWLG